MVNPSAARHLALVVGVLLCFFVYMGYHIKSRRAPQADAEHAGFENAAGGGRGSVTDTFSLMTTSESAPAAAAQSGAPVNMPSGLPLPIGAIADSGLDSNGRHDGSLSLADDLLALSDNQPSRSSPSGSIEESIGAITGLTADTGAANIDEPAEAEPAFSGSIESGALPPPPDSFRPTRENEPATVVPSREEDTLASIAMPPAAQERTVPPSLLQPSQNSEGVAALPSSQRIVSTNAERETPAPVRQPPAFSGEAEDSGAALRTYVIRPGDTLSSIAASELGSMGLADNIFLLNRDVIANPDHLTIGTRIKLPPLVSETGRIRTEIPPSGGMRQALSDSVAPAQVPAPVSTVGAVPEGTRVYRIRPGDTLSSIALRFYGSSSGWRFLYESNAATIPNPNQLVVGTEITVPPYGER